MVCNTFSGSGWSFVRSALLYKGRYFEKETINAPPQTSDLE
jgi:hypothetical protein